MRLSGLDLLRIFAAVALMVAHAGFWLAPFGIADTTWMFLGHVSVELFLVAMGFLVAQHLFATERKVPVLRSWARSVLRLWPLYLVLLVVNLMLLPAAEARPDWAAYLFLTQNLAWPHPHFFGEAWIVAAAMLVLLIVPVLCRVLQPLRFVAGSAVLLGLLVMTTVLRGWLVMAGNPAFDEGVRKVLIMRLDLPVYAVLAAWLWVHRYEVIIRWRAALALLGGCILAATAWVHSSIPLDQSVSAGIFLFALCDAAWLMLLPWVCALQVPERVASRLQVLASSAFAGLLTYITILRCASVLGVPLHATGKLQGVLMLSSFILLASGVAILVTLLLDRPLLALRERWLPLSADHRVPVAER
ncbi:MAG TPA: acyltransferase family protein [Dokdonella sp.]|uniref:acyltransferase family protein n=1 Tax=Dokdonella sp. TaxID=2291710 RepID=UPI002D7F1390|nr:acyltransferase family protein [Dokdonella sp.]HET9031699.1 acyltransferase family protein [Dokdonella sp.]